MLEDVKYAMPAAKGPIIIARHGRPALDRTLGPRLDWQAYQAWWAAYEAGGLQEGQIAPQALKDLVMDADRYFTSTRRRAQETFKLTLPEATAEALTVFNEAPLPPPQLSWLKVMPKNWNVISRISWLMGNAYEEESAPQARQRARQAATILNDAAQEGKVFLAAHGWFNRMIRKELIKGGWRCTHDGGDKYWAWRYYEDISG